MGRGEEGEEWGGGTQSKGAITSIYNMIILRHYHLASFPGRFCILQAIKNWTVGRPGNNANYHPQLAFF